MSDPKEEQDASQQKGQTLDLSGLQGFSFGPNWSTGAEKTKRYDDRPERKSGGDRSGGKRPGFRNDRRPRDFKRPEGRQYDNKREFTRRESKTPPRFDFKVDFYPEDAPFIKLARVIRGSYKTYELFEIAKLILEKNERLVAVIQPKKLSEAKPVLYVSVPDGVPFLTEEEALNHIFKNHLEAFFTVEDVEIEAPKGSFPIIAKCGITGELLGPPNYHKYQHFLREHHQNRLSNMSYDRFLSKIHNVKDEAVSAEWIEKMKKGKRYLTKDNLEGEEPKAFENWEEARAYLLSHFKNKLIKTVDHARISGSKFESLPKGVIRSGLEAHLAHQRQFPLETANNIRGRLRRMNFAVYKRGSKGVSFVCGVKRRFRDEDTTFGDSIAKLVEFLDKNPGIRVVDLPEKFLGFSIIAKTEDIPVESKAAEAHSEEAHETTETTDLAEEKTSEAPVQAHVAQPELTEEQQTIANQFMRDLKWLIVEGYVTEYVNGKLLVQPILPKGEENEHHDEADTEAHHAEPVAEQEVETPTAEDEAKDA